MTKTHLTIKKKFIKIILEDILTIFSDLNLKSILFISKIKYLLSSKTKTVFSTFQRKNQL